MIEIKTARQIGAAIREARTHQELTQQELADAAGVSRGLIARLEKGTATALYPEKLLAVLDAVGLSLFIGDSQADSLAPDEARQAASSRTSENAEKVAMLQQMMQPSMARIAEQLAAATANADFLKTSPLVAPHEKHVESSDRQ